MYVCMHIVDANILVQQSCTCNNPFRCECPGHIGVTYVLTDMDLLCFDGQSLTGKYVEWADMKLHEPAGTPGMKPSEVHITPVYIRTYVVALYL